MKNIIKKGLFAIAIMIMTGIVSVNAESLPVIVNGTQLTDEVNKITLGDGTLTYNKDSKELKTREVASIFMLQINGGNHK